MLPVLQEPRSLALLLAHSWTARLFAVREGGKEAKRQRGQNKNKKSRVICRDIRSNIKQGSEFESVDGRGAGEGDEMRACTACLYARSQSSAVKNKKHATRIPVYLSEPETVCTPLTKEKRQRSTKKMSTRIVRSAGWWKSLLSTCRDLTNGRKRSRCKGAPIASLTGGASRFPWLMSE